MGPSLWNDIPCRSRPLLNIQGHSALRPSFPIWGSEWNGSYGVRYARCRRNWGADKPSVEQEGVDGGAR